MTCDISKTAIVENLFEVPATERNDAWRAKFFAAVVDASLACSDPRVSDGPDGFPYAGLMVPAPFTKFEAWSISTILELCTEDGYGIAINPKSNGTAEWVFTYGDLVCLRMFGKLEAHAEASAYLPDYCRRVLRKYLGGKLGIANPGVCQVFRPSVGVPELMFSVFPEDFPTPEKYRNAMNRISWFLPRHYIYLSVTKDSSFAGGFQPL